MLMMYNERVHLTPVTMNPKYVYLIFVLIILFVEKSFNDYGSSSYQSFTVMFSAVLFFFILKYRKVLKNQEGIIKLVLLWLIWMMMVSFIIHPSIKLTITLAKLFQSVLWVLLFLVYFIFVFKFPYWFFRRSKQFFYVVLFFTGFLFLSSPVEERNLYLSYYALASLPWVFLFKKASWRNIGIFFILFISTFSEKRGGFLAFTLATLFFYGLDFYLRKGVSLRILYLFLILGFLSVLFYLLTEITGSSIIERFNLLREDEGSGRIVIYEDLSSSVKKFDWRTLSFGNGHNSTEELIGTFAHNEFLQVLVDYGIIGLLMYIFLHLTLIKKSIILIRSKSIYSPSFLASYIIFLTISMVSHWFVMAQFVIILVSYWGFIFALTSKKAKMLTQKI